MTCILLTSTHRLTADRRMIGDHGLPKGPHGPLTPTSMHLQIHWPQVVPEGPSDFVMVSHGDAPRARGPGGAGGRGATRHWGGRIDQSPLHNAPCRDRSRGPDHGAGSQARAPQRRVRSVAASSFGDGIVPVAQGGPRAGSAALQRRTTSAALLCPPVHAGPTHSPCRAASGGKEGAYDPTATEPRFAPFTGIVLWTGGWLRI